jgi:hypothetical protein
MILFIVLLYGNYQWSTYIDIPISHCEHFVIHIFAFILCVVCKQNLV